MAESPPRINGRINGALTADIASPHQAELLAELYQQSFGNQVWCAQDFDHWLVKPNMMSLLAKYDGQYVGFICYQYWRDTLTDTLTDIIASEAEIILIGTKHSMTRQSIGSFLLQQLEQGLGIATDGAPITQPFWQEIFLDVAQDNHAAINLYLKNHYQIYGKRQNYYPNRKAHHLHQSAQPTKIDALLMKKSYCKRDY